MASGSSANPPISASKKSRIDIWRTEVAAQTLAPPVPPTPSSMTTATTNSTSSSSSSTASPPFNLDPSDDILRHRPSIWRRLARRVLRKDALPHGGDAHDQGTRTEMYKALLVERGHSPTRAGPVETRAREQEEVALDAESSHEDGGAKGQRHMQERIERAARLLNQGVARDDERL